MTAGDVSFGEPSLPACLAWVEELYPAWSYGRHLHESPGHRTVALVYDAYYRADPAVRVSAEDSTILCRKVRLEEERMGLRPSAGLPRLPRAGS